MNTKKMMSERGQKLNKSLTKKGDQCVVYVRCSTVQSVKADLSISCQKDACIKYVNRKGFKISKVFSDNGVSGIMIDKSAHKKMLQYCEQNEIKNIIVTEKSRLSRNILLKKGYISINTGCKQIIVRIYLAV